MGGFAMKAKSRAAKERGHPDEEDRDENVIF
jgi:hypothetical protein